MDSNLFEPISVFKARCYVNLRDLETRRAKAARVAHISESTARRLDAAEHRCGLCGQPRKEHPMPSDANADAKVAETERQAVTSSKYTEPAPKRASEAAVASHIEALNKDA